MQRTSTRHLPDNEKLQNSKEMIQKSSKGNEQTIAKLEAKLASIKEREEELKVSKEELKGAQIWNEKLQKNNRRLQSSIEGNEQMIAKLEAKLVFTKEREKGLEEHSKQHENAHESLAKKYRAFEVKLQDAKDCFENEAKRRQQVEDQIESILAM
ncbi:unnamed protein product [Cylindrotheca closterium]|uniref:Uncharacterized protein n=1 Tax=Cylindrotheca closterium TaxID=2856 RepID=A0AAD2JKN7_9STRA|nr:unnamed protein product [Cylindrotheca closterium]